MHLLVCTDIMSFGGMVVVKWNMRRRRTYALQYPASRMRSRSKVKRRKRTGGMRVVGARGLMGQSSNSTAFSPIMGVARGPTGFGMRRSFRLNYVQSETLLGSESGGIATLTYRINSIFDPYLSGGGGTPFGYTALKDIYDRYVVTSVDYKVVFTAREGGSWFCFVKANDSANVSTSFPKEVQQGNCQWKAISGYGNAAGYIQTFTGHIDIAKVVGVSRSKLLLDDTYSAQFGANPANEAYLKTGLGSLTDAGGYGQTSVMVEIVYYGYAYGRALITN